MAFDPYHDEDASDYDDGIGRTSSEDDAPLIRTFRHVSDTIMNGGFCSPRNSDRQVQEEEEVKKQHEQEEERIRAKRLQVKTPDTTMDATSSSDESESEPVSFPDEPLIVSDLEVPDDDVVGAEAKSARATIQVVGQEENAGAAKAEVATTTPSNTKHNVPKFVLLVAIFAALYQFFNEEILSPAVLKLVTPLQGHLIMLRIRVEDATGAEMDHIVTGVVLLMLFLVAMNGVFASEKRLKSFIEFAWGVLVCSIVISGMYFTYDLASN